MDIGSISSALTSLKAAVDIGKMMLELKTDVTIQAKVIELQSQILSAHEYVLKAQIEQFELNRKLAQTESEFARLRAWESEKQRYKLIEPSSGVFVYCLKDDFRGEEPIHWLCTTCYNKGVKSLLQCTFDSESAKRYHCQGCNDEISMVNRNNSFPTRPFESRHWYER